jgi:hypothetical protein
MTVIAFDGKTLAADKLACNGNTKNTTTKIRRAANGSLLAVCGDLSVGMEMVAWYEAGAKPTDYPTSNRDPERGCSLVCIAPTGEVWRYESGPHPFRLEGEFFAFGCGDIAALVAMACGKTAAEAVEVVSRFDRGCGNGVDSLELVPAAGMDALIDALRNIHPVQA